MPSPWRTAIAILGVALFVSFVAPAYEVHLSDEAVREAYFLGQRRDETTAQFLETYRRYFPIPESGPHVYAVELFTPYAQAVEVASKHGTNYSAQQAKQDYLLRDDLVRIGVHMRYTTSYGPGKMNEGSTHSDRWKDFGVNLLQDGKKIDCRSSRYEGTQMSFGGGKGGGGSRPTGFIIWQEYAPANLESSEATVEVDTPDGQHIRATFDLSRLR